MTSSFLNSSDAIMEHLAVPTLTALIGTVIGAILGGLIAYHFGKKLADRQDYRRAAASLAQSFQDELIRLESREDIDTHKILAPAFLKHQKAVQEFMFHLSEKRQLELIALWHEYYCLEKTDIPLIGQYMDSGSSVQREKLRELATQRIRRIMAFASKN